MGESKYNILFLCTGNSARSIMAEVAANHPTIGLGKFNAYSAGSQPTGTVNPFALETLERHRLPTGGLRSKSWDEFSGENAPKIDFVITVCSSAAGETCPVWPGQPMKAHWGVDDPAAVDGSDDVKRKAFNDAFLILKRRVELLAALPIEKLDKLSLSNELSRIGHE